MVLGQLGDVLAQDVDTGSQVNVRQADAVDGEQSSGHLASTGGRNPEFGHGILLGLFDQAHKEKVVVGHQAVNPFIVW